MVILHLHSSPLPGFRERVTDLCGLAAPAYRQAFFRLGSFDFYGGDLTEEIYTAYQRVLLSPDTNLSFLTALQFLLVNREPEWCEPGLLNSPAEVTVRHL